MTDIHPRSVERLAAAWDSLEHAASRGNIHAPTMRDLDDGAASVLHVLTSLTEAAKGLHQHAENLSDEPRAVAARPILETLISELIDTQASAFDLHRAVQDPDRPSKFVSPAELATDPWQGGEGWGRVRSHGEQQ